MDSLAWNGVTAEHNDIQGRFTSFVKDTIEGRRYSERIGAVKQKIS